METLDAQQREQCSRRSLLKSRLLDFGVNCTREDGEDERYRGQKSGHTVAI
jgi:hypothetical protein